MLANEKLFEKLEESLREKGKIQAFEKENGPITGRMMIMPVDLPDDNDIKMIPGKKAVAFEATFDFYNVAIGIALYPELGQVASKIWVTPQTDNPDDPDDAWAEFFVQTLAQSIDEDGNYGYPIYSFVNDTSDMTVVPTLDK